MDPSSFSGEGRQLMRLFISAGEPSGDVHGANLIHKIRERCPEVEVVGFGGPHMTEAGAKLIFPLVELAVMWFLRVLLNINKFFALAKQAEDYFRDEKPDAVILIDYPGFHWHIAKRATKHGIPVIYYVPPQLWAWAGWRVEKMKRTVNEVLCSLPFEPAWYEKKGLKGAVYVGHPFFDEQADRPVDQAFLLNQRSHEKTLVAILPGSRTQELTRNLPIMLKAAKKLVKTQPNVRFAIACLHDRHKAMAQEIVNQANLPHLDLSIHAGKTVELIKVAKIAWAVSGSVGLELMLEALPTVVLYKVNKFDLLVARRFIKSKYISLVNLLADAELFPEYLTPHDVSSDLAAWGEEWLSKPEAHAKASQALADLRERVAKPGASDRAADRIVAFVRGRSTEPRGPHFKGQGALSDRSQTSQI
jgi:lipid-A-disaccharide synthase